jgi:hypothetical protein
VKRYAEDHEVDSYLALQRFDEYLEKSVDDGFNAGTRAANPWYTSTEPVWTNPTEDADLTGQVALHQMRVNDYRHKKRKAVELKDFMLRQLPSVYREAAGQYKSPQEIFYSVHDTLYLQSNIMAATLDQEYSKLRGRKGAMLATQFCERCARSIRRAYDMRHRSCDMRCDGSLRILSTTGQRSIASTRTTPTTALTRSSETSYTRIPTG